MNQQLKIILFSVFALLSVLVLLFELGVFGQNLRISNLFTRSVSTVQGFETCKSSGKITYSIPRTCEVNGVITIETYNVLEKEAYIKQLEDDAALAGLTIYSPEITTGLDKTLYPGEKFSTSTTFLLKDIKYTKVINSQIRSLEVSHSTISDKNGPIKTALATNTISFAQSTKLQLQYYCQKQKAIFQ
jgi:hypothetical protein